MAFVRGDKLGRIYAISQNSKEYTTPDEFKETLNHFRGRQLKSNLKSCLDYLKLSLASQKGDVEAMKQLDIIHKSWNK